MAIPQQRRKSETQCSDLTFAKQKPYKPLRGCYTGTWIDVSPLCSGPINSDFQHPCSDTQVRFIYTFSGPSQQAPVSLHVLTSIHNLHANTQKGSIVGHTTPDGQKLFWLPRKQHLLMWPLPPIHIRLSCPTYHLLCTWKNCKWTPFQIHTCITHKWL